MLGVADWLLVSVEGVVLEAGAVLDDDVLLDGVVLEDDELVAPVWALSFVAVPVVEVAGALVLCPAGVVSAACVVSAGAVPAWLELEAGAAVVDEVWSVTGGCPAAFDGFAGAVAPLWAFGSVVLVVGCELVLWLLVDV